MHKLIEYVCDELDELERKVDKGGKLSASEMQYLDTLAHTKKNLLKAEEMSEDMEYSGAMMGGRVYNDGMSYNMGGSYARDGRRGSYARGRGRNARRDSMGRFAYDHYDDGNYYGGYSGRRYSRDEGKSQMIDHMEDMMEKAESSQVREVLQSAISKLKNM